MNGRLDTLQAAILLEKLAIFSDEIDARNVIAERYDSMLPPSVKRPVVIEEARSVWAQYTIQTSARDDCLRYLNGRGIPAAVYYARPLHQQRAYERYPVAGDRLIESERLAATVLSLPMHPYLSIEDQSSIAACLRAVA
jgi:dTDP-4-amino-4,6-dideoxygalactose transaminase